MIIPLLTGITFAVMRHNDLGQRTCRIVEIGESLEENKRELCQSNGYLVSMKLLQRKWCGLMLPITRQWFRIGTTLWSNMWMAYNDLDQNGYEHQTVNHKPCRSHVDWSNHVVTWFYGTVTTNQSRSHVVLRYRNDKPIT